MPPTTLKLPAELRQRIHQVIEGTGQSAHAFMLEAIERETRLAEQRRSFVAMALEARAEIADDGHGYQATEVHAYVKAKAAGGKPARPKATRWRR